MLPCLPCHEGILRSEWTPTTPLLFEPGMPPTQPPLQRQHLPQPRVATTARTCLMESPPRQAEARWQSALQSSSQAQGLGSLPAEASALLRPP